MTGHTETPRVVDDDHIQPCVYSHFVNETSESLIDGHIPPASANLAERPTPAPPPTIACPLAICPWSFWRISVRSVGGAIVNYKVMLRLEWEKKKRAKYSHDSRIRKISVLLSDESFSIVLFLVFKRVTVPS